MLIIVELSTYGTEKTIRDLFGQNIVWGAGWPHSDRMLIEFQGFAETLEQLILANLSEFHVSGEKPREIYRYAGTKYRPAILLDHIRADRVFSWGIPPGAFPLFRYSQFLADFLPELSRNLAVLASTQESGFIEQSKRFSELLNRFRLVMNGLQGENLQEYSRWRELGEKRLMEGARKLPFKELLLLASEIETRAVQRSLISLAFKKLVAAAPDPSAALWELLQMGKKNEKLKNVLSGLCLDERTSLMLKHVFRFPQALKGQQIEVRAMEEVIVEFGCHLAGATFIGPVKLKRTALHDPDRDIYVCGSKKLKQQVARNGGRINKYGNTLVTDLNDVESDLLTIERIDAYSCTNPALISGLRNRSGRVYHVDDEFISRIKKDYREGRKLADIAIEELFGIDPDMARNLYKGRSRR